MREIRFRQPLNGEWHYWGFGIGEALFEGPLTGNGAQNIPSYQFTGLLDKNGKGREMYEGDVYKQEDRYYVIEWYETKCAFIIRSLTSGSILPGHLEQEVAIYDDYEYVGSIHEHPELLEREGRT